MKESRCEVIQFSSGVPVAKFTYKYSKKEKTFEYFCLQIASWWKSSNPDKSFEENDLGKIKIMKLLFFTVAASTRREDKSRGIESQNGLLDIFNNWYAMPYGHVEKDIDDILTYKKGDLGLIKIGKTKMYLKEVRRV